MSQPGGKKGGKGPPKKSDDEKNPPAKPSEDKEETSSNNGDKKEVKETNGSDVVKPPSAGINIREVAAKILVLAQKGEWSAVEQTLKVLEKLVAAGGDDTVSVPMAGILDPSTGMTPLMYAVKDNRTSFVERLIELGSDVGARNNDNYNVLHISAMYSREDIVKLLLSKRGVDPFATGGSRQQTAVHIVASRQTGTATSILRALLTAAGKDIRLRVDGRGKIPLLLAVEAGNQSMVRELLSAQTAEQLKATTPAGETALHLAARRRDVDMARILVDYGAAVDATNGAGQTPLHIAAAEGDEPLVKYFYGVRANAAIADNEDRTPMHLAAENGHAAIIELLADKFKASIFERTKDGSTLMHIASLNGHADCAMMLFKKGVYLHMPNKDSLPQPPFENIFEANNDSAVCPQKEEFNKTLIGTLDCLTLNIYVPNSVSSQNKLPVLIHIYGGEFKIGFAGRYIYGPKYLVRHDIILVLFNYRLGPYGFFCCTNPECSGNQGLKDQKKAIKWVHDNIDSFGGDPNKITIAGHSSGATSLDLLLHSLSANEKLFDKAIFQSGMMNIPEIMRAPNDKVVLEIANSLNLKTDCFNNALNFLSTVDPKLLIETTVALNISVRSCIEQKFDNVEHYLTDHIINLDIPIIKGMPILIGNTDNERLYMYENRKPDYFDDLNVFYEELSNNFELDNDTVNQFEKQIRNFYMGERKISMKTKEEITDYTSDFYYYHPTRRSMSKYLKNGAKNVFYYIFAYTGNRNFLKSRFNITKPGAVHADEIGYLFDISYMNKNPTPEDQLIIDRMTTLWANFIKYGNPTPERTELLPVKWQPYTKESEHYLNIDTHLSLNTRPFPHRMAFWDMFYELNAKYQIHYKDNINN